MTVLCYSTVEEHTKASTIAIWESRRGYTSNYEHRIRHLRPSLKLDRDVLRKPQHVKLFYKIDTEDQYVEV